MVADHKVHVDEASKLGRCRCAESLAQVHFLAGHGAASANQCPHRTKPGRWLPQMHEHQSAVGEVEGPGWQTGRADVANDEGGVRQALRGRQPAALLDLLRTGVDTDYSARRSHLLGEPTRHVAATAAENGDALAGPKAGTRKQLA